MKPRIPLAYAGFLIIALVAVVGFAAFSPSQTSSEPSTTTAPESDAVGTSARVASAILALRVSDAESRTATTNAASPSESTTTSTEAADDEALAATTTSEAEIEAETATTSVTTAPSTSSTAPADTTPPALSITSPDDESTVDDRIVTFSGTTEPGATVTSGPYEADVDDDGSWSIRLVVAEGPNGASFTATDDAGNSTTERIVVYYEVPSTTTTKAPSTTTTTSASGSTPTTTAPPAPKWSPLWPADPAGNQDVENWRSTVAKYFPAERIDCVLGIIQRESKGNPRAYNSASSAEGLMQHLSKYWHARAKGAGFIDGDGLVATPYNGEANIAAGAWLASYYDRTTGNWWSPWKSGSGEFTAFYGSCQSPDPS